MKTKLILLSVFVLFINACAAPSTPQPSSTNVPTLEATSIPEPTQPPVPVDSSPTTENAPAMAMTTYTDDYAGFSLDYPADWYIESSALAHAEESFAYSVSVASWNILHPATPAGKDSNGLPPGGAKIDVSVTKEPKTLEKAVTEQSQVENMSPLLARKDVILANGLPAVILDRDSPIGLVRTLITTLNGNVIYVSGYGNLENYEAIALTLRAK